MPKQMPKRLRFTDLAIQRLKGPDIYWDTLLPRFGCRATHKSKTWIVNIKGSKKRFGRFPQMKVTEARAKAREMLEGGVKAEDPSSFKDLAEQFLEHGRTKRGRPLRPETLRKYRYALLTLAVPLHDRRVTNIRRSDAATVIRTAATKCGATTAMRTRAAGSRFYSWLIANDDRIESNPFSGTEGYSLSPRSRVLSDVEIAAIWAVTEEPTDFHLIVRLLLWTGCRRSEAGGLRWAELSTFPDGTMIWTVRGSRTKNHRDLILPLPRQAQNAVLSWHRIIGKDTLFGGGPNGFTAWSASKNALDARLGLGKAWSLHDLRRSVQTHMLALGITRDLTNLVLNHALSPIDEAYDRYHWLPEKAEALQKWADELHRIVHEHKPTVIRMPVGQNV